MSQVWLGSSFKVENYFFQNFESTAVLSFFKWKCWNVMLFWFFVPWINPVFFPSMEAFGNFAVSSVSLNLTEMLLIFIHCAQLWGALVVWKLSSCSWKISWINPLISSPSFFYSLFLELFFFRYWTFWSGSQFFLVLPFDKIFALFSGRSRPLQCCFLQVAFCVCFL